MSEVFLISGNAGQGKTTIARNLASALREFGYDVLLVDGDTRAPKVQHTVGLPLADRCVQDVLFGRQSLERVVYRLPSGLKVLLSAPCATERHPAELLSGMQKLADVVVVDVPAWNRRWFRDGRVLLVTQPEFPSVLDVSGLSKEASPAGLIINRAYDATVDLTPGNIEQLVPVPVIGVVPDEPRVRESLRKGYSLVEFYPDVPASYAVKMLAAKLMNVHYQPPRKRAPLLARLGLW